MNPKDPRDQHPNTKAEIAASKAAEEQARAPVVQQRNPDGSLVPYPDTRSASVAQNATQATQDAQGQYPAVRNADGSIVGHPDSQRQVAEAVAADEAAMRERRAAGTSFPTDQARTAQEGLHHAGDIRSGERHWNRAQGGTNPYTGQYGNPQYGYGTPENQYGGAYPGYQGSNPQAPNQGIPPKTYSTGSALTTEEIADYRSLAAGRDSTLRPPAQVFKAEAPLTQQEVASYFAYAKLPENLHNLAKEFYDVAAVLVGLPASTERTVAIRKLLESRDSAVRVASTITTPDGTVPAPLNPDPFSPTNQNPTNQGFNQNQPQLNPSQLGTSVNQATNQPQPSSQHANQPDNQGQVNLTSTARNPLVK